jgi:hypothetical protein
VLWNGMIEVAPSSNLLSDTIAMHQTPYRVVIFDRHNITEANTHVSHLTYPRILDRRYNLDQSHECRAYRQWYESDGYLVLFSRMANPYFRWISYG